MAWAAALAAEQSGGAVLQVRLVCDSDLNRKGQGACSQSSEKNCLSNYPLNQPPRTVPPSLVRAFRLQALDAQGHCRDLVTVEGNYQRLVRVPLAETAHGLRWVPLQTWGAPVARLFAFSSETPSSSSS